MTNRFELLERLGKGGMGVVWKARDREFGQLVALKLLHDLYLDDPTYLKRFEREVEVSRRIDSPHVVRVLGYGIQDGQPYMSMELVEGVTLRQFVKDRGPLPWDEARPLLHQVASGLAAAHQAGIIHRDLKPSNILLDAGGNAKLADFGIARAVDLTRMTGASTMLGTPQYMSPDANATTASDLYSFGCICYEVLTGVPPFAGESQQEVIVRHLSEPPDVKPLPAEARQLVAQLLEKDPIRRPRSAAAIAAALAPQRKPTARPVIKRLPRPKRRRRFLLPAAALFALLAITSGSAAAYFQPWAAAQAPPPPAPMAPTRYEAELLAVLNAQRRADGLPQLIRQPDLDVSAAALVGHLGSGCDAATPSLSDRLAMAPALVRDAGVATLLMCNAPESLDASLATWSANPQTAALLAKPEFNHVGLAVVPAPNDPRQYQVVAELAALPVAPAGVQGLPLSAKTTAGIEVTITSVEFINDATTHLHVHVANTSSSATLAWGYGQGGSWLSDGVRTAYLSSWRWARRPDDPAPFSLQLGPGDWFDATLDFDLIPHPGSLLDFEDGAAISIPRIQTATTFSHPESVLASSGLVVVGLPATAGSGGGLQETVTAVQIQHGSVHVVFSAHQNGHISSEWTLGADGNTTLAKDAGLEIRPTAWGVGNRSSTSGILRQPLDSAADLTGWADFPIDVTGPAELTLADGALHFPILKVVAANDPSSGAAPSQNATPTVASR